MFDFHVFNYLLSERVVDFLWITVHKSIPTPLHLVKVLPQVFMTSSLQVVFVSYTKHYFVKLRKARSNGGITFQCIF